MNKLTLGSLFDGSGGFPLGGLISGIAPVWASEIEPFPIRVTTKRLPFMKHYGDVSRMDGGSIEPVDIITFGSPCQDMSIAGKREGLDGNRSGLFYEAVRIIKEMISSAIRRNRSLLIPISHRESWVAKVILKPFRQLQADAERPHRDFQRYGVYLAFLDIERGLPVIPRLARLVIFRSIGFQRIRSGG